MRKPVAMLLMLLAMAGANAGECLAEGFVESFDYANHNSFRGVWGTPVLGGHVADDFEFDALNGALRAVELVDSTDGDGGNATATFSRPIAYSGDFAMAVELSWLFSDGSSHGHVYVELRDGQGVVASCGMMDDWVYRESAMIAAWAQIGGPDSLYVDDMHGGATNPVTNGLGAIATSLVSSGGIWVPPSGQRWNSDGQARITVTRSGDQISVNLHRDGAVIPMVAAQGSAADLVEIRIKFSESDNGLSGYPNSYFDVDGLAVEHLQLTPPVRVVVTESDGETSVGEHGPTSDSYTLRLSGEPDEDVQVTITADSQVVVDAGSGAGAVAEVIFTPGDWDVEKNVTVTAVDDDVLEGDHSGVVSHMVSSWDLRYHQLGVDPVVVQVADNECGLWGFLATDLNRDCRVDLQDLAVFAGSWLACTTPFEAGCQDMTQVEVGVARVDVTPATPIRLSGYAARCAESVGVQQALWAKALAIGSGPETAVLVSVDSTGLSRDLTERVRNGICAELGIPRAQVAIGMTHSHSAPVTNWYAPNLFGGSGCPITPAEQGHIDQYSAWLEGALVQVALDAAGDRSPGRVSWGQGETYFAANRRTAGGPVDHDLPVLKVTGPGGEVRAIVVSYACHCTTLSPWDNVVSGDWAGYAAQRMEEDWPGATAMVLIGAGADANPNAGGLAAAQQHGQDVADEVGRALAGAMQPLEGAVRARSGEIALAYAASGNDPLPYEVQSWSFGGDRLAMVFLEGELVVDYALRLKGEFRSALGADRLWVNGFSNSIPGYIPSERILDEGGYEAESATYYYGLPGRFADGLEDQIVNEVNSQLHEFLN